MSCSRIQHSDTVESQTTCSKPFDLKSNNLPLGHWLLPFKELTTLQNEGIFSALYPSQQLYHHFRTISTKQRIKCLAQGYNSVTLVSHKLATFWSQV